MQFRTYAALSLAGVIAAVAHALGARPEPQLFLVITHLLTSKPCLLALGNGAVFAVVAAQRSVQALFLGKIRAEEYEDMWDRASYAIPEACYALAVFGEGLSTRSVALLLLLLSCKVTHWVLAARARHLEQRTDAATVAQPRLLVFGVALLLWDALAVAIAVASVRARGASVVMLFGFEFAVLAVAAATTLARLASPPLTGRAAGFVVETTSEASSLALYVLYVAALAASQGGFRRGPTLGLPLHVLHGGWAAARALWQKAVAMRRFRRLERLLDSRCVPATAEQLAAAAGSGGDGGGNGNVGGDADGGDDVSGSGGASSTTDARRSACLCVVCRQPMIVSAAGDDSARVLPECGHIIHLGCLRLWLRRQQSCPTCRRPLNLELRHSRQTHGQRGSDAHGGGAGQGAGAVADAAAQAHGGDGDAGSGSPQTKHAPLAGLNAAGAREQLEVQLRTLRQQVRLCEEQRSKQPQGEGQASAVLAAMHTSLQQQVETLEGMLAMLGDNKDDKSSLELAPDTPAQRQ